MPATVRTSPASSAAMAVASAASRRESPSVLIACSAVSAVVVRRHRRSARARVRRRHGRHQPEPRCGTSVAAVPDGTGGGPPREQGRGHGGLDRQQRPRRSVRPMHCLPRAHPGVGDKVIGVASLRQRAVVVRRQRHVRTATTRQRVRPSRRPAAAWMAKTGTTSTTDDACVALPAGSPDRQGRAGPSRLLLVPHQVGQRPGGRRRRRRALQQCRRRHHTDRGWRARDHDSGRRNHGGSGRDSGRLDRRRRDDPDLDQHLRYRFRSARAA